MDFNMVEFQKSPQTNSSPTRHKLKRPSSKHAGASIIERKKEESVIAEYTLKVPKVESGNEAGDFHCYNKSDSKMVHVDVDKKYENRQKDSTLSFLPNNSDEKYFKKNGEIEVGYKT